MAKWMLHPWAMEALEAGFRVVGAVSGKTIILGLQL
jgi:hypothetical protein